MSVPQTPAATSRIARPLPFTPNRAGSSSSSSSSSGLPGPSALNTTNTKQYKAALSSEVRPSSSRPRSTSRPTSPTKKPSTDGLYLQSRPKTPTTPRSRSRGAPSPVSFLSEMDVSRIDPEEAVVDAETVEPGDLSGDIDESLLQGLQDYGQEDKVLVSIRVKPTNDPSAWDLSKKRIKLDPTFGKASQDFTFDEILTGSENKPVYTAVARSHVFAAMDGFNAVIFAYGQTASGKTFTLSGNEEQPGIIPRAMKDIFGYIKRTPGREYLLRCSYLEIYNENIHDLLAPPAMSTAQPVQIHGTGPNVVLAPLREEVVTSLKGVKEVLERGEGNRRTATTDWNERSSRSHSVFRVVIESRERWGAKEEGSTQSPSGRTTPGFRPPTPGGARLQARGGKTVQVSVLSLIDLAGSEKATSDKERTREGKYINTSLLTLGTVIGTLAENSARGKSDHVPFRNSKLTRMLQPSLSGDARISVICTINPSKEAIAESSNTLLFAQRVKRVQLHAQKKEIIDTDALLQRYKKEIEELKQQLSEREADAPVRNRRLSAQEQLDESKAMRDLNARIKQLTKLILTSQTVDETKGDESRPASPSKVDFDMTPYQLQQELLSARREIETQATQILSLEAALLARPALAADAPDSEKDKLLVDQAKTIRELDIVVKGYEDNLGEPLRKVKEDVEREWATRLEKEVKLREEKTEWADELVRQLERERKVRMKLEEERQALAAFVRKFDSLASGGLSLPLPPSKLRPPMPAPGGAAAVFAERQRNRSHESLGMAAVPEADSPMKPMASAEPSLMEEQWDALDDLSFEADRLLVKPMNPVKAVFGKIGKMKENLPFN